MKFSESLKKNTDFQKSISWRTFQCEQISGYIYKKEWHR